MREGIQLIWVEGQVCAIASSEPNALDFWIEVHTIGKEWEIPVSIWLNGKLWASTRSLVEVAQ